MPEIISLLPLGIVSNSIVALNNFVQENIILIVTGWLAGIAFFSARYVFSLNIIRKLKRGSTVINHYSVNKISEKIRVRMKLKSSIEIAESRVIKIPSVIGIIKPLIILPSGLLNGMPFDQIEMILAHEFAHIKRLDPLFKLAQSLIEVILFYNPFIWIISNKIDVEREKCCDDAALCFSDNKLALSKALHFLAGLSLKNSAALQLTGKNGNIYSRVQRILKPEISYAGRMSGMLSGFAFTVIISMMIITASVKQNSEAAVKQSTHQIELANTFGSVDNAEDIISLLEKKFGDRDQTPNLSNDSEIEDYQEFESEDTAEDDLHADLTQLDKKLERLLGGNSGFLNTLKKLEYQFPEMEYKMNNKLKKINTPEKFNSEFSFHFDFDFDEYLDLKELSNLKKELADLEINFDSEN